MGVCINCNRSQYRYDNHHGSLTKPIQPDEIPSQVHTKHKKLVFDDRFNENTFKEAPNAIVSNKPKGDKDIELILSVLKNHYIFNSIDKTSQLSIIKKVRCFEIGPKETIFEQGQPGICFFVVSSGRLEVKAGNEKRILGPGKSFGELALIDNRPRTATVKTLEPCVLWGLDRENFMKALKRMRVKEYEANKSFISSINIFNILTPSQKESLLGAFVTQRWQSGQIVVKEGDNSEMLYIIKEGIAILHPERTDSREMHKGDYFGEHALLNQTPQQATIMAATDLLLISIGRSSLSQVLGASLDQLLYRNSQRLALERSSFLKSLLPAQRESIIDKTQLKKYKSGEKVVEKGRNKSEKLFIVVQGRIVGEKVVESLQCLGEEEIGQRGNAVWVEDFLAIGDCDVAEIGVEDLEKCIGGDIKQAIIQNDVLQVLRQVQLLRGLDSEKIEALAQALKIQNFQDSDVIVAQNNPGHSFFIIKSGSVKVFRDNRLIRNITKNDYFGERSVLFNDFRTATVVADGPVNCWVLDQQDFISIINEDLREKLIKRIELQDTSVLLSDLVPVKLIHKGELGNVNLTVHKEKGTLYIIKSILRQTIEENRIHSSLILEKSILMQIDHVMIIKLIKTFKDDKRIYFLLEYVNGKDLFDVCRELGKITEEQGKFYAASLIVTLEYLHDRNIIHRDLKPENVVIDEEGYTKLIDFGAANIIEGRTYTAIGTPHYLAPEIILRTGYSLGVDWWSLGILIHEMIFGYVPFGADDEDPIVIYEKILENKLDFIQYQNKFPYLKQILLQLLNKNPAIRTCGGFKMLKKSPWFDKFSWDRLLSRQLRPPYSAKNSFGEETVQEALNKKAGLNEFLEVHEGLVSSKPARLRAGYTIDLLWDNNF